VSSKRKFFQYTGQRFGCIVFHEKVFKLGFGFILECGRSGPCWLDRFICKITKLTWTIPMSARNCAEQFSILSPREKCQSGNGMIESLSPWKLEKSGVSFRNNHVNNHERYRIQSSVGRCAFDGAI
jgi:hypothetical protein